jgi:hypothetical protein
MQFFVNGGLACYVLRTNSCTVHIVSSVLCELIDKLYQQQLHAQSLTANKQDTTCGLRDRIQFGSESNRYL